MVNINLKQPQEFMATSSDFIKKVQELERVPKENINLHDVSKMLTDLSNSLNGIIEYYKKQQQ